jgi:hypothetical protein
MNARFLHGPLCSASASYIAAAKSSACICSETTFRYRIPAGLAARIVHFYPQIL